ncbi:oligosaccharide flippase family protein [Roseivivax sp. CAU 1761]
MRTLAAAPILDRLRGTSLGARVLRSSMLTTGGFAFSQLLRLLSNLVLTRLLFPEAFGLMALVAVFLQGLAMFSDVGVSPAILQSKRGDEPAFLDTAWTIQVIRGALLWLAACLLAWPVAQIYGEPLLAQILPVAALTLLIAGFNPTRMDSANRHLLLGRVTALELLAQLVGLAAAIGLAFALRSVWALVISGILGQVATLILFSRFLPGPANRFRWEGPAAAELIGFGKWIFLSTVCGFVFLQADKLLIGRWLPLDIFGIYNIGYFLAAFPLLLGGMVTRKVLIPIYRETPPRAGRANFLRLRRMRVAVTALLLGLLALAALAGPWAVALLYDPRYHMAGAVVLLLALVQIPQVVGLTYDQAALAAGDSRRFFLLSLGRAAFIVAGLLAGLEAAGLAGAILGQGAAYLAAYPLVARLARRLGAWDPMHDLGAFAAGTLIVAAALWWHGPVLAVLAGFAG